MDTTDPDPLAEEALAIFRAVEELAESDDAGEVMRRGLRLARTMTGAGAGLLAIDDETRHGWLAQVLAEGARRTGRSLVRTAGAAARAARAIAEAGGTVRCAAQNFNPFSRAESARALTLPW